MTFWEHAKGYYTTRNELEGLPYTLNSDGKRKYENVDMAKIWEQYLRQSRRERPVASAVGGLGFLVKRYYNKIVKSP